MNRVDKRYWMFVLSPTSIPTRAKVAVTMVSTKGFFNSFTDFKNVAGSFAAASSILVNDSHKPVRREITPYNNKVVFQSLHLVTANATRIGPNKELRALIN